MNKLLFLVDDTDSILTLGASILENDFRVLTMSSAGKMFTLLEKKQPDLIILDIEMPEINGFEACAMIKENPTLSTIPVLFLTGYIDEKIKSKAKELGAQGVINKSEINTALLDTAKQYT